jgi:hypothetical protein
MAELHQLIHRWAGLGPESFLRAIAPDHAKALLADSAGVLGATGEVGLAGPGRLHDLFVTHEAMSRGAGVSMAFDSISRPSAKPSCSRPKAASPASGSWMTGTGTLRLPI